ncbi:MAG: hypothetical protein U1F54_20215 [Burkholderiales bacterium]
MALWTLAAHPIALGAQAAGPNRVLVLHSFGHDFSQYDAIASVFRTGPARLSAEPLVVPETTLDAARKPTAESRPGQGIDACARLPLGAAA